MATSGTTVFAPDVAEIMDEAYERAGLDPATIEFRHVSAAVRSFNLMLKGEWASRGVLLWAVDDLTSQALTQGDRDYTLPANTIDVIAAALRRDGKDVPMGRLSREDYLAQVDKAQEGRPYSFYVDRQAAQTVLYLWPVPENSTDTVIYSRLRPLETVTAISETLDLPQLALDAAAAGVGARLALKFASERYTGLKAEAKEALELLAREMRDRTDVEFSFR